MKRYLTRISAVLAVVAAATFGVAAPSQANTAYNTSGTVDEGGTVVAFNTWRWHDNGTATWTTSSVSGCGLVLIYERGSDGAQRTDWLGMDSGGVQYFLRNDNGPQRSEISSGYFASDAKGQGSFCPGYSMSFYGQIYI